VWAGLEPSSYGKVFAESDWSEIESAKSRLREGIRAKVRVHGRTSEEGIARIDWEPPVEDFLQLG
jgi:hypothetical protein